MFSKHLIQLTAKPAPENTDKVSTCAKKIKEVFSNHPL